ELWERMELLEYDALMVEACGFIERAQTLQGYAARQNEAVLHGRLGELLFHSGRVREAEQPFDAALRLCRELNDGQDQTAYVNDLLEVYRYLRNSAEAIRTAEDLVTLPQQKEVKCDRLLMRIELRRRGEPLCRIVCVRDGEEQELDEISQVSEGRYEFQFRRNRLQLPMAIVLLR